jgi:flagellin
MSSLLTNTSAMTALQNLANTQKDLMKTQSQISSGLAVANASDNAAYWSIATSMRSDTSALGAVTNALNLGASVLNTATSAMNSVETILKQMKADIVTAQTSGTNATQVQSDITAQQQSLISIMGSASFNGVNLLDGSTVSTNIVDSFSRGGSGTTSTGVLTVNTANIALGGAGSAGGLLGASLGLTNSTGAFDNSGATSGAFAADSLLGFSLTTASGTGTAGSTDLNVLANAIDAAISSVTQGAATLGQYTTTVNNQLSFTSSISDAITSGVGSLVDADMNVASTRLQALQTQQQLGIQALSMANQNSQLILKLFNG